MHNEKVMNRKRSTFLLFLFYLESLQYDSYQELLQCANTSVNVKAIQPLY